MKRTAIIIGASSGIGKNLTKLFLERGYRVGLMARRKNLLEEIKGTAPELVEIQEIDIGETSKAKLLYKAFLSRFQHIDLIVNCAGIGFLNKDLELEKEVETNKVNINGFTMITNLSIKYFIEQGIGHYAAITSI